MTYSIWLIPSKKDVKYLNSIIRTLAKQNSAPKFSAHITVFSGITSLGEAKSAVSLLDSGKVLAKNIGIGQSDYLWKTLFVKIKKNANLTCIHKSLQEQLGTKYNFAPHISLIYKKMSNTDKRKIKSQLEIKKSFYFDGVAIIRSSKDVSRWKVLYRTKLA